MSTHGEFYARVFLQNDYSAVLNPKNHQCFDGLSAFVRRYSLGSQKCLEIGSGRGAFQDLVPNYTGVDVSESVRSYYRKPFYCAPAESLPFEDSSFDAAWSCATLEHVEDPERGMAEMRRVIKLGGVLYLEPAWQCRPWRCQGYPVRPYKDFDFLGKLIKASIPIRDSLAFRSCYVFPRRLWGLVEAAIQRCPRPFRYRRLKANFDHFWMSDSDALNSMDPFDAILWFVSRGDKCLNYPSSWRQFWVRTGGLVFEIRK